jgi:cation transport ATPase
MPSSSTKPARSRPASSPSAASRRLGDTKPAELLLLAASAEKYSNHPTAKALATLAGEAGVPLAEPKDFTETAGRGVKAEINGARILVGRAQWLKDNGIDGALRNPWT